MTKLFASAGLTLLALGGIVGVWLSSRDAGARMTTASAILEAASPEYTAHVVWRGDSKAAIADAVIRLLTVDRKELVRVKSDSSGSFTISRIPGAQLIEVTVLRLTRDGYAGQTQEFAFDGTSSVLEMPRINRDRKSVIGVVKTGGEDPAGTEIQVTSLDGPYNSGQVMFANVQGEFVVFDLPIMRHRILGITKLGTKLGPETLNAAEITKGALVTLQPATASSAAKLEQR